MSDFNNTSGKSGILQNCETMCGLSDGAITTDPILLAKFTAWANEGNQKVATALMKVDKFWRFDDLNYDTTNAPLGTQNLSTSTNVYALPVAAAGLNANTLLGVGEGIYVLTANGKPYILQPAPYSDTEMDVQYPSSSPGTPIYYKLVGKYIKIWPWPSTSGVTLINGLNIPFRRVGGLFTTASTTTQPGFISPYHDLVELWASHKYLIKKNPKQSILYKNLFDASIKDLQATVSLMDRNIRGRLGRRRYFSDSTK